MINELSAEKLRMEADPKLMRCETTKGVTPIREIVGQERAIRALKFGIGIKDKGFNIYAAGYPGTGRTTAVRNFLEEIALTKPAPSDWCYVNNFSDEYQPKAIRLPLGQGEGIPKGREGFNRERQNCASQGI